MKTITVELSLDEAERLLSEYREARNVAIEDLQEAREKVEEISQKITRLEASINGPEFQKDFLSTLQRRPSGRAERGESEKLISDFLKNRNGTGASMKEVCEATGAKYATAYRILHKLEEKNFATEADSKWRWIAKDLSAANGQRESEAT